MSKMKSVAFPEMESWFYVTPELFFKKRPVKFCKVQYPKDFQVLFKGL